MRSPVVKDLEAFEKLLGKRNVVTDGETLRVHNTDWTHKYSGKSKCLVTPEDTKQVSALLKYI